MLKQLLSNPIVQFLIGRAIGAYMQLAAITTRWERINEAAVVPFRDGGGKAVIAVWHGRILQAHKLWAYGPGATKVKVLISQSREGEIVSHAAHAVSIGTIRGSAAKAGRLKGGVEAMRAMARHIQGGGVVCITPDGPRGPRMRVKAGAVHLAKMMRVPLVGLAWSSKGRRLASSWDRMALPGLFDRGVLIWSDPVPPPAPNADDAAIEACRAAFEAELNRITAEADARMGHAAIEPAPPEDEPREARVEATTAQ